MGSMSKVGKSGKFCHWICSLSGNMSYMIHVWIVSEKNRAGLHLDLAIHTCKATAVHPDGMWMDLDSANVFPSKFSSVSKTSLSSVHNFFVPCLVHPTEIAFGMVKSLPKMIGLLIFVHTINKFVKVCSFIVKSNIVIPFLSMS